MTEGGLRTRRLSASRDEQGTFTHLYYKTFRSPQKETMSSMSMLHIHTAMIYESDGEMS